MTTCAVFGGSKGIGFEIVRQLCFHGNRVALLSRNDYNIRAACNELYKLSNKYHDSLVGYPCDVTDENSINNVIKIIQEKFGTIDVLVNAAGINKDQLLVKSQLSDIQEVLNTNLVGSMLTSKAVIKHMLQRKSGCIINIGSVVGMRGNAGQTAYSASKSGLIGFSKSLAKEVGSRGIRVNVISPGFIDTDMTAALSKNLQKLIPLQRVGISKEVAEVVLFIINASYITGQVISVDGGLHLTMN